MTNRTRDEVSIPLVEERLTVDKRTVEPGRVRIQTRIDAREEWICEKLEREEISVERVPIDQLVDTAPRIRQEDDVLVIPLVEEVLIVEKRFRVKEELHVRTLRHVDEVKEPVTLRSMRAVIEREGPREEKHTD